MNNIETKEKYQLSEKKSKKKKVLIIWGVVSILLLIIINWCVGSILVMYMKLLPPQYSKYAEEFGQFIYNLDDNLNDDTNNIPGAMKVRSLMSDSKVFFYEDDKEDFYGFNTITYTYLYLCENHDINEMSYGSWINVYKYDIDKLKEGEDEGRMEIRTSFAMFDFNKAIQQGYGEKLQEAIRSNENIIIKTDKYALKGYELIPLHIIVMDGDTIIDEYTANDNEDIPDGYEIVYDDNIWIYNKMYQNLGENITDINISDRKEIERLQSLAFDTAAKIDFSSYDTNSKDNIKFVNKPVPGKETVILYSVTSSKEDGQKYAIVIAASMQNGKPLLIISGIGVAVWTFLYSIIVLIISARKKRKIISKQ